MESAASFRSTCGLLNQRVASSQVQCLKSSFLLQTDLPRDLPAASCVAVKRRNQAVVVAKAGSAVFDKQPQNGAVKERLAPVQDLPVNGKGLHEDEAGQTGRLIDGGMVFRESFVIRCYEVGVNKTASMETIANLLQELGCNHAQSVGFSNDGFATTPRMLENRLIWVTTRMHIEMYKYPKWGDIVEIDTWFQGGASIMSRRDWIIRFGQTGEVIGRGTSSWAMMNMDTRRLSRIPPDVREELVGHCPNPPRFSLPQDAVPKVPKLDEPADYCRSYLRPRRSDLDMNHHVNNVTYIAWMLESLPQSLLDSSELAQITLEYRCECGQDDVVETLAKEVCLDTLSVHAGANAEEAEGASSAIVATVEDGQKVETQHFLHILRSQEGKKEINKGRTIWRKRA